MIDLAEPISSLEIGNHRLRCPGCDKGVRDDALSVTMTAPGEGVYHCFRCGWKGRIGEKSDAPKLRIKRKPEPDKLPRIMALLKRARPIRSTIAERYLCRRGITLPPPGGLFDDWALRYVPDAFHWPTETQRPCLLGVITNTQTNQPQGLHQTFLNDYGTDKASIDRPRLYFGPKAGGVVRLTADKYVQYGLAVAEGIETAFAGITAGYPTWASLDAGNLAAFPLLPGIEALTILADNDPAGMSAAGQCADRWAEREVIIQAAPDGDWNDFVQGVAHD